MTVSAADVKRLRDTTGAGMLDCRNALAEAEGDVERAIEILRVKGAKGVGKREGRTAGKGLVIAVTPGDGRGTLLELACETDFVAKTPAFQELAAMVAELAHAQSAGEVATVLTLTDGEGRTVQQLLDDANAAMGEKVEVRRVAHMATGHLSSYVHKSDPGLPPSLGVLLALDVDAADLGRDVAQQVAAMAPRYILREEVPAAEVAAERRIAEDKAREEGKPEQAIGRIVEGRLTAYYRDTVLVDQAWVRDPSVTIGSLLADRGATVTQMVRFKVGSS